MFLKEKSKTARRDGLEDDEDEEEKDRWPTKMDDWVTNNTGKTLLRDG